MANRNRDWGRDRGFNRGYEQGDRGHEQGNRGFREEQNRTSTGRDFMTNQPHFQSYGQMERTGQGSRSGINQGRYQNWRNEFDRGYSEPEGRFGSERYDSGRFETQGSGNQGSGGYGDQGFSGSRSFDSGRASAADRYQPEYETYRSSGRNTVRDRGWGNEQNIGREGSRSFGSGYGSGSGDWGNQWSRENPEGFESSNVFQGENYRVGGWNEGRDRGPQNWGSNRAYSNRTQSRYGSDYGPQYGENYPFGSYESFSGRDRDRNWGEDRGESFGDKVKNFFGVGPKGYKRSDDRVREEVSERLEEDPFVDASNIEINVKDGEVTLTGSVPERRMKRAAEDCVEGCRGVKDVHNQLRVQSQTGTGVTGTSTTGTTESSTTTTTGKRGSERAA